MNKCSGDGLHGILPLETHFSVQRFSHKLGMTNLLDSSRIIEFLCQRPVLCGCVRADEKQKFDELVESNGVRVLIDPGVLMHVIGTEMDFQTDRIRYGTVGRAGCRSIPVGPILYHLKTSRNVV